MLLNVNDNATTLNALTAVDALKSSMPGWTAETLVKGTVTYSASGTIGDENWAITANFNSDPAAAEIAKALQEYAKGIGDGSTTLTVDATANTTTYDITPE